MQEPLIYVSERAFGRAERATGDDKLRYVMTLTEAKAVRQLLGREIEKAEAAIEEARRQRLAEEYIDRSTRW